MAVRKFAIDRDVLSALRLRPAEPIAHVIGEADLTIRIAIPDYAERVTKHYGAELAGRSLADAGEAVGAPFDFRHFGLIAEFRSTAEIKVADGEARLHDDLRAAIDEFGPLAIRNATLDRAAYGDVQRNIFPHLRFHFDRGHTQPNRHSLFTRDPDDPQQRSPRTSSTLFAANLVAHLQYLRESGCNLATGGNLKPSYEIFAETRMSDVVGRVVLEQPWSAPEGTGEICLIDNRTVLHASYHPDPAGKGWPIGAQYLY